MDLERKIGQLFVVPARGDVIRHVRENHVGGVIWFESTAAEAARMNAEMQSIAETPLLISADLESGMGMRFTDTTWWPPAMALAATGDPALAEEQARITAEEALAIGVNHILAPVADVNVDPKNPVINTRSFGEDAHDVARYVAAMVRGTQEAGCLATAKHFPGHGDTHIDSHRALPVLDVSRERLESVELVPFRAAIDAGVASVMIGHLAVPSLDDTPAPVRAEFENVYGTDRDEVTRGGAIPATVSARVIRDLLRRDLGFEGLVVTDSFDMGGLAAHFDPGEAAVCAIEAGEDQILFSADTDAAIAAVKAAVRSGRISVGRIEESVERILRAKQRVIPSVVEGSGRVGVRSAPPPAQVPRYARDDMRANEIAQRAITLVRDGQGRLPLTATDVTAIVVSDFPEPNPIPEAIRELKPARVITIDSTSPDVDVSGVVVMLLALRPKSGAGRIAIPAAARRIKPTIAVSFGSPYVLRDMPTAVCAYGIQPVLQIAAIRAIRGQAPMSGRLPVTW